MVRTKEEKDEDLEWFKSTFRPIPKPALPDDCVEYCLYIIDSDIRGDNTRIVQRLREVQKASAELTKDLLKDYIWQRESYRLELAREDGVSVLRGRTNFGDSIEDEWVIVFLLRELSKHFPKDLWIRVIDNDEEFLLIEGIGGMVEALDGPEVGNNKVWINEGRLKVVKNENPDEPKATTLTLQEAKKIILENPDRLGYFPDFEKEAFHRLQKYPEQIKNNFHFSILRLPRKVAYLLHQKPAYVSPAVEVFYLRDPIALRPLQAKTSSNLILKPQDFVKASVKFPKVAFAQMKSQEFQTPPVWQSALSDSADEHACSCTEMGMKLSCGFEMLLSDPQNQDKPAVREVNMLLNDIDTGDDKLPSDADIESWGNQDDDEAWMKVNFEDLERELAGQKSSNPLGGPDSWTDKDAQDNLQRIVAQFQKFLGDDDADAEGAAFDFGEDSDDEGDAGDEDSDDSGEDKEHSFDETEFANMMRVMMGMPPGDGDDAAKGSGSTAEVIKLGKRVEEVDTDTSDDESDDNIEEVMKRVEAELNEAEALDLDPKPRKSKSAQRSINSKDKGKVKGKGKAKEPAGSLSKDVEDEDEGEWSDEDSQDDDEEGGEDDIDYALLKNLLESFKGQAGTPGPAGNLMGLFGMNLPRDEGEDDPGSTKKSKR